MATTEKRAPSQAEKAIEITINAIQGAAHDLYEEADDCNGFDEAALLTAKAEGLDAAAQIIQGRLDADRFRPSILDEA